jgi:hypothetical protein
MKRYLLFLLTLLFITSLEAEIKPVNEPADSSDVLIAFTARIKEGKIILNWKIFNPKNTWAFELHRLDPKNKQYSIINKGKRIKKADYFDKTQDENQKELYHYSFEDEPERDGVYFYKLRVINSINELMYESDEMKIGISGLKDFKLGQNHPNPFNPVTYITYELFSDTQVKLSVFDLVGKELAVLVDQFQTEGEYTVTFDASKISNLPSGIYFYKLDTEKFTDVKKMILTK